jgi:hypothetical protein
MCDCIGSVGGSVTAAEVLFEQGPPLGDNVQAAIDKLYYQIEHYSAEFGALSAVANWVVTDTSFGYLVTQIGAIYGDENVRQLSGRFSVSLTDVGQKFMAFGVAGLDVTTVSKLSGIVTAYNYTTGQSFVGWCGYLSNNVLYISLGDMGGLNVGDFDVFFDLRYLRT